MNTIPVADHTVLGAVLQRHARQRPAALFAHFPEAQTGWTYADALAVAQRAAAGLQSLGVQRGERVLCWLPNGMDFLRAWFGANYIGALHTPCNLAWRGGMLENALALSGARVAIVHADLLPRLAEINCHALRDVIVIGAEPQGQYPGLVLHSGALLERSAPPLEPDPPLQPWNEMQLIFTSGTTGPSKGAACSYTHLAAFLADGAPDGAGEHETFLLVLPLFHAGGASSVYTHLLKGNTIVLPARFRSEQFWPLVRQYGVTTTTVLGVMTPFLLQAPAAPDERSHPLKVVSMAPLNGDALAFAERFGVRVRTSYGATEMGVVLTCEGNTATLGSVGRLRDGYEARLVDDHDFDVAPGAAGEFIIRSASPWVFFSHYVSNPEATLHASRNGWYHSGDLMTRDADGLFRFKDRKKDTIRRRGENVSSQEVEAELLHFAGIREVAAYAVPANHSEDEIMVCVSVDDASGLDWRALVQFLQTRMPHYMVPRYFRLVPALARNATGKVRKDLLREEGVTPDAWDREAAGIIFKGERIGAPSS